MKLFKMKYMETNRQCQQLFNFELPSTTTMAVKFHSLFHFKL